MEACLAICTETWLKDGQELDDDIDDLLHGSGIGMITLNASLALAGCATEG